jgi:hypothetical protein
MRKLVLLAVLAVLAAATLPAEPRHMLDFLLPRGGSRGTIVEVAFHGISLESPREVLFYTPGIRASDFVPLAKPGDGFKAKFEIAADCPLGEHVLRVRTATSLSDAVTFWVSRFPTVMETETKIGDNDTFAKAQPVPLNSTVEGQIQPGDDMDRDVYRVDVQQGQRLSVEVEAARLGTLHSGGENDLAVRILDARGNEIGSNDDSALYVQDPVLSIVAPATGQYYVEIRQQFFQRPQQAWYRAHIGNFSRPTAIFPAGGQTGSALQARVLGDPTGERTEAIALPATPGNLEYYSEGAPSPNVLRVSPYLNVIWAGDATPVPTLPAALNGIIDKTGEAQTYRFTARKNAAWQVRVYGRTLGAPIDPKIWIRAANTPKNLLEADDARLQDLGYVSQRGNWRIKDQLDPIAIFAVPADGAYLIGVEDTTGAVNLYTMLPAGQYDAKEVAQDVSQLFTGIRVQCAQCHNHPFDRWTQDDYYGFVSFFTGVKRKQASEAREFYVYDDPNAPPAKHLLDGHPVPPKFLGGEAPDVTGKDPRVALAAWLTSKDNALFRQNLANRIWAQFFGRGIVEPVDDVRISNPPSNRELLEALGQHLADYNFDARRLVRDICNSRIYQLDSAPNATNRDDDSQFSHARLRRLRADVMLDAISEVTATPSSFNNSPGGLRAVQLFEGGYRANNLFLKTFGLCSRESINVSETRLEPTLAQALHLINGDTVEGKLARSTMIADMLKDGRKPEEILDAVFIRALSRLPSEPERKRLLPLLANAANPADRKAYDDVLWAILNSTEFAFNH